MATEILRPNANGDTIEFTPDGEFENYQAISEAEPDGFSTLLYAVTHEADFNATDLYNLPNHSTGSGTINSIKVYGLCIALATDTTVYAKLAVKTGGEVFLGSAQEVAAGEEFGTISQVWETNPDTEKAWTWDDIDGLQIGINSYTTFVAENAQIGVTQIYLEVNYSEEESLGDIVLSLTDNKLTVTSGADEATYSITDNKITLVTGGNNYTFNPFESPYLKSIIDNLLTIDGSILTPDS